MRYAIFSDVHANLEALEAALDYYCRENIDKFIFVGDIVGYGADPACAIAALRRVKPLCVAGNHDWAAVDKFDLEYFNRYAKTALLWTKQQLTGEDGRWLEGFNLVYQEDDFVCVHGTLRSPASFYYLRDINEACANFPLLDRKICFVGHSHQPGFWRWQDEQVVQERCGTIEILPEAKYIINLGSVGQPRDGDARACVWVYDSRQRTIILTRLDYDIKKAADKIREAGLPPALAARLFSGE